MVMESPGSGSYWMPAYNVIDGLNHAAAETVGGTLQPVDIPPVKSASWNVYLAWRAGLRLLIHIIRF
jgi:hypothetical protein